MRYIAETCNSALRTGSDDITGFFRPSFLPKVGLSVWGKV
jgi:hypothetical protein